MCLGVNAAGIKVLVSRVIVHDGVQPSVFCVRIAYGIYGYCRCAFYVYAAAPAKARAAAKMIADFANCISSDA